MPIDTYGNWSWDVDELEQTPMQSLSRRGRHIKRRLHRRKMNESSSFKCMCTPRCDFMVPAKPKLPLTGGTMAGSIPHVPFALYPESMQPSGSMSMPLSVPLSFWFSSNPGLSIPQVAIPYGQRFVSVTIEPIENTGG